MPPRADALSRIRVNARENTRAVVLVVVIAVHADSRVRVTPTPRRRRGVGGHARRWRSRVKYFKARW